jgi:ferric-dicitrate binding protein FerR (iron transport regulator)
VDEESRSIDSTPNPRQVRARRRRRRRRIGTLVFVAVAAAVLAAAYFAVAGGDDSSEDTATTTGESSSTPTTVAFSGSYAVTTGVNVRQGPGTTFPTVATVETGKPVTVVCVAEGEQVNVGSGPSSQWLRVMGPGGYVFAPYVAVGQDLATHKIPACPAT